MHQIHFATGDVPQTDAGELRSRLGPPDKGRQDERLPWVPQTFVPPLMGR